MHHQQQQAPLPLGDAPQDYLSLRAAFHNAGLDRACGMTFEQFLADPTRRKCLGNVVQARLKALAEGRRA